MKTMVPAGNNTNNMTPNHALHNLGLTPIQPVRMNRSKMKRTIPQNAENISHLRQAYRANEEIRQSRLPPLKNQK